MLVGLVFGRCIWVYLWFIKDCCVLLCLALFASINNLFSVPFLLVLDFGLLVLLTSLSVAVVFLDIHLNWVARNIMSYYSTCSR